MRTGQFVSGRVVAASGGEGEFAQAGGAATATGNERDVELIVQVLAAQKGGRATEHTGSQEGFGNKLAPRHLTRPRLIHVFLHGIGVWVNGSVDCKVIRLIGRPKLSRGVGCVLQRRGWRCSQWSSSH